MEKKTKKIELSKETLRELTMRPLTEDELKMAAGGQTGSCRCSTELHSCRICYED